MMTLSSFLALLLAVTCSAQTFRGRVVNGSTGNPVPSSQVILFTSSGEQGRTLTNDSGEFRIAPKVNKGRQASAILQVKQDGVDYFKTVMQGQFADFTVYQSADKVSLISGQLSILQFQSIGKRLQVTELHALNNLSTPPVTQVDPNNFILSIPSGARIEPATVSSSDGGSTKLPLTPVPGSANQYRIEFPIKPGMTKYAIRYELPYDAGAFVFRKRSQYPMNHIGVMIPKSMSFRSLSPHSFHPAANPKGAQEQEFELDKLAANTAIAFSLSGAGELTHSFRPLQPGEHPSPTLPAPQTSAVSRAAFQSNPLAAPQHSRVAVYERSIALAILLSAAALVWSFFLRAKVVTPGQSRVLSTDADLPSHSRERAVVGRREAPDKHR